MASGKLYIINYSYSTLFQAHMQARYVIMRVLMECATSLFSINVTTGSDGNPDLVIQFDRSKIETIGRPAIGEFLKKLQVRATTTIKSSPSSFQ